MKKFVKYVTEVNSEKDVTHPTSARVELDYKFETLVEDNNTLNEKGSRRTRT